VVPAELDGSGRRRRQRQPGKTDKRGKKELAELRRKNRQLEVENGIWRAAAYLARESVLQK